MSQIRISTVAAAAALALGAGVAGAQVTNGSFETPDGGSTFVTYSAGATFGGWTVQSGSVDHIGDYWQAAEGGQSVDMSGNAAGSIYQAVSVTPGSSYDLFFALAGNPGSPTLKTLQVLWGSSLGSMTPVGTFVFDNTGTSSADMGWVDRTVADLLATDGTMYLQFTSLTPGFSGPALDDVRLVGTQSVVPEPSTVVLLASGLLGLGGVGLRRRRRGS